jgi:3-oxoadipate enol-lactonase
MLKRFLHLVVLSSLTACATGGANVGGAAAPMTESSLFDAGASTPLQTPITRKINTGVGQLAVFDFPLDSAGTAAPASAPTLVLWPSVFADSSIYAPLVTSLRGKARVVLIDGPGHGASGAGPERGFSVKDCAVAVKTILDELAVRSAAVGGTSWGGIVGGEFALLYPQATDAVVMLNTPVFSDPGMAERFIVLGTRVIGGTQLFSEGVAKGFLMPATLQAAGAAVQQFHRGIQKSQHGAMANAVGEVLIKREPLAPRLSGITAPTLFVVGEFDDMYPAAELQRAAKALADHHFATLPTRHISVVDEPARVAGLIEALLFKRLEMTGTRR